MATHGGLARFDGIRFVASLDQNAPGLRDTRISCLLESRDGALWVGTDGGGLCRVQGSRWTCYTDQEGLAHERIRAIQEGRDGTVWIGTYGGGLICFRQGTFSSLTEKNGLSDKHVLSLCEDLKGVLWIGTRRGLDRWDRGKLSRFPLPSPADRAAISCLRPGEDGEVWAGTSDLGLFRIADDRIHRITVKEGLPADRIQSIYQDREKAVWIGTLGGGLARLISRQLSALAPADGLSDQNILCITEDREGNLWIGTENGLNKLSENRFVHYGIPEGLAEDSVNTVFQDRRGRVWAGNKGGQLNRFEDDHWTRLSTREGLLGTEIGPIAEAGDGSLWIGSYSGLVQFWEGRFVHRTSLLKYPHVSAIGATSQGLVVATGMRLNFMEGSRLVKQFELPFNLKYIFAIHEDRQGRLWLATRAGLACLQSGRHRVYTVEDGLASEAVHAIHEDAAGDLWLATAGGLSQLHGGGIRSFTARDGLFDNVLFRVLEDSYDNLWLSCSRGIFRVSKQDLEAYSAGRIPSVRHVAYTSADGLKSPECAGPTQPAGWKTQDGRLWFPTVKGIAVINPQPAMSNRVIPPVVIERVAADGRDISWNDEIRLSPGKGNLEFEYTALSFVAPQKVTFRYRLEGYDPEWTQAGSRRIASFFNLPPGKYRFRVSAANGDGLWNEEGASVGLELEPHFYQTYWFYFSCAACFLGGTYGLYLLRLNRIRAEFAAVTDERNRIAREIHDTLAQGFAGISVQLEAGKQMLFASPQSAEEHLDQANTLARSCLEEVRQYVWDLRHHALERKGVLARLSQFARTMGSRVSFKFHQTGSPCPLDGTVEDQLTRIGQEAILNSLKHAQAGRIEVELRFESKGVTLRIQDNGCGFTPSLIRPSDKGGFGLQGMKERADELGATFRVKSHPGKGTCLEVGLALVPHTAQRLKSLWPFSRRN